MKGNMKNILLVCSAGMSTSALVKRMEDAAKQKGVDVKIWAVGASDAENEAKTADVVMLGPQASYLLNDMKNKVNNEKPVAVIDMLSYGRMDGNRVLNDALALLN
jgi:PTS system cellobiose-specific IIB component